MKTELRLLYHGARCRAPSRGRLVQASTGLLFGTDSGQQGAKADLSLAGLLRAGRWRRHRVRGGLPGTRPNTHRPNKHQPIGPPSLPNPPVPARPTYRPRRTVQSRAASWRGPRSFM